MKEATSTISLKLPINQKRVLEKIAEHQDRSKSAVMRIALQRYFEYLEDREDYEIAEKAYKEYVEGGEQHYTLEEIRKMHDL